MDPYKILGIEKNATKEEIRRAYREKAKKHHPDRGGETWAFQQVQEAYEILLGKRKRSKDNKPKPQEASGASASSAQHSAERTAQSSSNNREYSNPFAQPQSKRNKNTPSGKKRVPARRQKKGNNSSVHMIGTIAGGVSALVILRIVLAFTSAPNTSDSQNARLDPTPSKKIVPNLPDSKKPDIQKRNPQSHEKIPPRSTQPKPPISKGNPKPPMNEPPKLPPEQEFNFPDPSDPKIPNEPNDVAKSMLRELLTIKKLRTVEHQLISAKNCLLAYRAFLAQSGVSQEDQEIAKSHIRDFETLAEKDAWWIGGKWLAREDISVNFARSEALIIEAVELAKFKAGTEAQKKMDEASKVDLCSFHADFLMGLHGASVSKDFRLARRHFEECVKRGRALRPVLGPVAETNFVNALNNLALTQVRENKLDEAYELWNEALEILPSPPPQIVHNIVRTLRYMEFAQGGPVLSVTKNLVKKFDVMVRDLNNDDVFSATNNHWAYLGFLSPDDNTTEIFTPTIGNLEGELEEIFSMVIDDRACLMCDGRARISCPAGCHDGSIALESSFSITDPQGRRTVIPTKEPSACTECGGQGTVDCPACSNGTDEIHISPGR